MPAQPRAAAAQVPQGGASGNRIAGVFAQVRADPTDTEDWERSGALAELEALVGTVLAEEPGAVNVCVDFGRISRGNRR